MPWKENSVSDQRVQFIAEYLRDTMSITDLCKHFGISRPTAYKFIHRYKEYGPEGLVDLPKEPHTHPNATDESTQQQIIDFRKDHPNWGARKMLVSLRRDVPDVEWPAASTIGELLRKKGMLKSRLKRRFATPSFPDDLTKPDTPNSVWTADYKGQFRLGNNQLCYPLTICDGRAKMILRCQALQNTSIELCKPAWVATFREYGLPLVIRTDNGSPFAGAGLTGLSRLSAWWIRLGIVPERIQPGKPQQNGSHERMHRTLKEEVASPPEANLNSQQKAFDHFVSEYNYIRPHESLGQQTPASVYTSSSREYPLILPNISYPDGFVVRNVRTNGEIRWQNDLIFVSESLAGEPVGLDRLDDKHWVLYYSRIPLAILDNHHKQWIPPKKAIPTLRQLRKELNSHA